MPDLSIVIPSWNGKKLLAESLCSILAQTTDTGRVIEIVVVDNGSTDQTLEWLQQWWPQKEHLKQEIQNKSRSESSGSTSGEQFIFRLKTVGLPDNLGFAAACNAGIRASSANTIAIVNNDVELHPGWCHEALAFLHARPDVHILASLILLAKTESDNAVETPGNGTPFHRGRIIDSAGDFFHVGHAWKRGHGLPWNRRYNAVMPVHSACCAAAIFRRSVFRKIGLFDESLFAYYEDVDLCLRARKYGLNCLFNPRLIAWHHLSATANRLQPPFLSRLKSRNLLTVSMLHLPRPVSAQDFCHILFSLLFSQLRDLLYCRQPPLILQAFLGKWEAILSLPVTLKKRRTGPMNRLSS